MSVIYTAIARVRDWQSLQKLNNDTLVNLAKAIKARHCRIYRNLNDASQAMLIIELADLDEAGEIREALIGQLAALAEIRLTDDRLWEVTDWDGIA